MIPPPAHRLGFNISPGTDYHGMRLVSRNKSKNNHKKETTEQKTQLLPRSLHVTREEWGSGGTAGPEDSGMGV